MRTFSFDLKRSILKQRDYWFGSEYLSIHNLKHIICQHSSFRNYRKPEHKHYQSQRRGALSVWTVRHVEWTTSSRKSSIKSRPCTEGARWLVRRDAGILLLMAGASAECWVLSRSWRRASSAKWTVTSARLINVVISSFSLTLLLQLVTCLFIFLIL